MNPETNNISFESPDMELLNSRKKLGVGFATHVKMKKKNFIKKNLDPSMAQIL